MSKSEHTPAPWVLGRTRGDNLIAHFHGVPVAKAMDNCDSRAETEANARLIAAAPDLLAMLKAANSAFYGDGTRKALQAALEGSKDLIRKAEGRT